MARGRGLARGGGHTVGQGGGNQQHKKLDMEEETGSTTLWLWNWRERRPTDWERTGRKRIAWASRKSYYVAIR